jgi:hypothetical protein
MHVEAHLLDCVGDVRPGEGEVLESPDNGGPMLEETLAGVSAGVEQGWQSLMPKCSRMSQVY